MTIILTNRIEKTAYNSDTSTRPRLAQRNEDAMSFCIYNAVYYILIHW
jgi:hypothetical protein